MTRKFILILLLFIPVLSGAQTVLDNPKDHTLLTNPLGSDEYKTEYYILRGNNEYPKILIDAGIHGDEIAGIYACDSILKFINVLNGTVILVPRVNLPAIKKEVRGDNVDLNQVFPGNKDGTLYEEKLAYDFMKIIEELKPDVVINLHEAWTKFDKELYEKKKDKSFGQTFITNSELPPDYLLNVLVNVNKMIHDEEKKFRIQFFPYKPNHSMDNIITVHKIPSYTVETLRILPLEERIDYHIICLLEFIKEAGISFTY
jgi:hypothetical protein